MTHNGLTFQYHINISVNLSVYINCFLTRYFTLQVRPVAEDEMFRVIRSGKRKSKYSSITQFHFLLVSVYLRVLHFSSAHLSFVVLFVTFGIVRSSFLTILICAHPLQPSSGREWLQKPPLSEQGLPGNPQSMSGSSAHLAYVLLKPTWHTLNLNVRSILRSSGWRRILMVQCILH